MSNQEKLTYEAAYTELTEIVAMIEGAEVGVDELAEKMKRASYLINFCSKKLRETEDAVNTIIRRMEDPGEDIPENDDDDGPF